MKALSLLVAVGLIAACSSPKQEAPKKDSAGAPVMLGAAPGAPGCPATGLWAKCSVLYRLERAGIAPHPDSAEKPEEKALRGEAFVVKFGANARLEVFLYPDSTARIADASTSFVRSSFFASAPQTINRERTLIENANLVALLTSLNDKLRERVSDALTAGAPQPSAAK